jgi:hypothetical protein
LLLLYAGQRVSAGGVAEDVVGAELVVLLPYGGGELLTGTELADELPPDGEGELLDGESVNWLREELDRLSVEADTEVEPVGNWLIEVDIPLEELAVPLLLREDVPPELEYWLGDEAEPVAEEVLDVDIEPERLELRVGDAPADELLLP